ncbi:SAM-dependent methyltransferase [Paractinoplanes rishiriensis]|uniref:S-adenosyl methyltransferase n=1 Tax=Paractinoplanes rishiriensis TaxID=1050105 RepID=A0A919MVX4_9ACTN|nr:SAM-dependent methyltransferase [Actinoplanes rishiriensis]GIE94070.1 hypothetical protein Ari01nite_15350 [Actinoplanes rishiriensis]
MNTTAGPAGTHPASGLNSEVPHSARIWNYWLGGKDNFAADRAVGDKVIEQYPEIVRVARESRAFLRRAVTFLTGEAGIRQFLDLGTGLPTVDNTHQVAQAIAPEAKIVYVDNDPLVLCHARALLTSDPAGATAYVDADVRDPDTVLREAAKTLDFGRPVAVMMLGILGHVADDDKPADIVHRIVAELAPASYLAVNDSVLTDRTSRAVKAARDGGADYHLRTPTQIEQFFDTLDLVEPGVVSTPLWRPDIDSPETLNVYCGIARKAG